MSLLPPGDLMDGSGWGMLLNSTAKLLGHCGLCQMSPWFTRDEMLLKARRVSQCYIKWLVSVLDCLNCLIWRGFIWPFPTTPNFWHVLLPKHCFPRPDWAVHMDSLQQMTDKQDCLFVLIWILFIYWRSRNLFTDTQQSLAPRGWW